MFDLGVQGRPSDVHLAEAGVKMEVVPDMGRGAHLVVAAGALVDDHGV